jgi:multicomponent Na+:H+ antiporter subunit D
MRRMARSTSDFCPRGRPAPTDGLALALMTAGLMAKTALFPFHVWLPPAHSGAPAPASALLSALVPKASFLILLRLWFEAMPDRPPQALMLLAALGAAAVVWGSAALAQSRLKMIVAYSTVAQIGYLFLVFPLAGGESAAQPWAAGAWTGASSSCSATAWPRRRCSSPPASGSRPPGSDRLDDLRGLARARCR